MTFYVDLGVYVFTLVLLMTVPVSAVKPLSRSCRVELLAEISIVHVLELLSCLPEVRLSRFKTLGTQG